MALPTWPAALLPASYTLGISYNTQSGGVSPFDKTEQTLEMPGGRWTARLEMEDLDLVEGRILSSFVNVLRGRAGRFNWGPPSWPQRGNAASTGGSAVINGGGQTGDLLVLRGFSSNLQNVLFPGDLLTWLDPTSRAQLHQVVGNGNQDLSISMSGSPSAADAAGLVGVRIAPPIRRSPNNGATINFGAPSGIFRLARDVVLPNFTKGMFGSCSIDIEEALF